MDNRRIDITSEGETDFRQAMLLATKNNKTKAVGYSLENGGKTFALYWTKHDSMTPFPYEMDVHDVANFVWGWLKNAPYGNQPDHDGDNEKGFRVYNEDWGHVFNRWEAFIAIAPVWAMYGK